MYTTSLVKSVRLRDATRPSRPSPFEGEAVNDGACLLHHGIMRNTSARIVEGPLHLSSEPGVMLLSHRFGRHYGRFRSSRHAIHRRE